MSLFHSLSRGKTQMCFRVEVCGVFTFITCSTARQTNLMFVYGEFWLLTFIHHLKALDCATNLPRGTSQLSVCTVNIFCFFLW